MQIGFVFVKNRTRKSLLLADFLQMPTTWNTLPFYPNKTFSTNKSVSSKTVLISDSRLQEKNNRRREKTLTQRDELTDLETFPEVLLCSVWQARWKDSWVRGSTLRTQVEQWSRTARLLLSCRSACTNAMTWDTSVQPAPPPSKKARKELSLPSEKLLLKLHSR